MESFGFIALLGLAAYLLISGLSCLVATGIGFGGTRLKVVGTSLFVASAYLFYVAFTNAPFSITTH